MDKQTQLILLLTFSLFGFVILGLMGENPFFYTFYMTKHQCDATPNGIGDSNCYNYKTFDGEWYSFEVSKQIAERSGADMERFCDYHKQFGKGCNSEVEQDDI